MQKKIQSKISIEMAEKILKIERALSKARNN